MGIVADGDEFYSGICERLLGNGESVGVRSYHAHHLITSGTQCLYSLQTASSCGDKIFDNYHLGACGEFALDEIAHSVVLGFAANIYKGFAQLVGYECPLGDGSRGYTGYCLCLGEILLNGMTQFNLHKGAKVGERQGLTVVTIDGRLPSRCPCERIGRLQFDSLYIQ